MNAFELFRAKLECRGSHAALIAGVGDRRVQLSFAELGDRVDAVAAQLSAAGLQSGDRVLLAVPVSSETFIVMLALLKVGLVTMLIEPAHGPAQIASILRAWPPAAIVATRPLMMLRYLIPELRRIPQRFVVSGRSRGAVTLEPQDRPANRVAIVPRSAADSAVLTFTSGSTGEPKPVLRTHGFLRQQLKAIEPIAEMRDDDVDFVAMPMFVLFNLAKGVTSLLPACDMKHPGRADPRVVLAQLHAERATRIVASPALLSRLASWCTANQQSLPAMRRISTGGGPVSPDLPGRLRRVAPDATVCMVYGSSEAEPIATVTEREPSPTATARTRAGGGLLAGRPVPGCKVRIIPHQRAAAVLTPERLEDAACAPGTIGEIIVSGKHVLTGYADPSHDRHSKLRIGATIWHRTGDAGYFDADGQLWLVGRCSAAIDDDFGRVYPFQVEYALAGLAGIRRAALIARDRRRVLALEINGREFQRECLQAARCLIDHHIDRIVFVRRIPLDKRHAAKIDYPALRRQLDGHGLTLRWQSAAFLSAIYRRWHRWWRRTLDCRRFRRNSVATGVTRARVR